MVILHQQALAFYYRSLTLRFYLLILKIARRSGTSGLGARTTTIFINVLSFRWRICVGLHISYMDGEMPNPSESIYQADRAESDRDNGG